jgi:hypothetical protein
MYGHPSYLFARDCGRFRFLSWRAPKPIIAIKGGGSITLNSNSLHSSFRSIILSIMSDDNQPTSQGGPSASSEAHEVTPEATSAEPKPTSAAEAPISHSAAAASTASPPPPTTTMTAVQDTDAPSLPARPSPQETTPAPTADPNQPPSDPRVASLQAVFPTFDEAVLYVP